MTPGTFTAEQKLKAVEREVKYREFVYHRQVLGGSMSKEKAKYEIDIMREIAADYETLALKERLL